MTKHSYNKHNVTNIFTKLHIQHQIKKKKDLPVADPSKVCSKTETSSYGMPSSIRTQIVALSPSVTIAEEFTYPITRNTAKE